MRIAIDVFAVFLIFGICNSGVSSGENMSVNGLLESILSLANSKYTGKELEDVLKLLETRCEKNGRSGASDVAKNSLRSFSNCTELGASDRKPVPNGDFQSFAKESCVAGNNFNKCIKETKDAVEPCLETSERNAANVLYNLFDSLVKFVCESDGSRVREFLSNNGEKCIQSKKSDLLKCISDVSKDKNSAPIYDGNSINGLHGLLELVPKAKDCKNIEQLQECSVKAFRDCADNAPADIVNSTFNSVKKAIDCADSHKSQASLINVLNVVILSAIMATLTVRFF